MLLINLDNIAISVTCSDLVIIAITKPGVSLSRTDFVACNNKYTITNTQ